MSNQPLSPVNPESWEYKEKQLIEESLYKKLSPKEQEEKLKQEKEKFEKSKSSLRDDLGYKPFKAPTGKETDLKKNEEAAKAKEMAEMEKLLEGGVIAGTGAAVLAKPKREKRPETAEDQKKFMNFFNQCDKDIDEKKLFPFESLALDDFGRRTMQSAKITKITDHSEDNDFSSGKIRERLNKKQTSPESIGIVVEIGNVLPNDIHLQNITMEISMLELTNGGFLKKIEEFTNVVLFAMLVYYRKESKKKQIPEKPANSSSLPKSEKPVSDKLKKAGIKTLIEGGNVQSDKGVLAPGKTSNVNFSCNNGSVWGTFDSLNTPKNPKELEESFDKINTEQ